MLQGVNDSDADARELVRLLDGIPAKVNLIPFNPWPGRPLRVLLEQPHSRLCRDRRGGRPCLAGAHAARPGHPGGLRPAQDGERAAASAASRRVIGADRLGTPRQRLIVGFLAIVGVLALAVLVAASSAASGSPASAAPSRPCPSASC